MYSKFLDYLTKNSKDFELFRGPNNESLEDVKKCVYIMWKLKYPIWFKLFITDPDRIYSIQDPTEDWIKSKCKPIDVEFMINNIIYEMRDELEKVIEDKEIEHFRHDIIIDSIVCDSVAENGYDIKFKQSEKWDMDKSAQELFDNADYVLFDTQYYDNSSNEKHIGCCVYVHDKSNKYHIITMSENKLCCNGSIYIEDIACFTKMSPNDAYISLCMWEAARGARCIVESLFTENKYNKGEI